MARQYVVAFCVWLIATPPLHPSHDGTSFHVQLAKARALIDESRFELARTYLDPLVHDPLAPGRQRSVACYERGVTFFGEKQYVSAAQDYRRALDYDSGNAVARAALAQLHHAGLGVERDAREAVSLSMKAARAGHVPSMYFVGSALLSGTAIDTDVGKARFWLKRAADADHLPALLLLARSYLAPFAPEPDTEAALHLYRLAASRGSTEALETIAEMTRNGARREATLVADDAASPRG